MSVETPHARRLARYAAAWLALTAWAALCALLGVPSASTWIAPCAIAAGTLTVLAVLIDHGSRK